MELYEKMLGGIIKATRGDERLSIGLMTVGSIDSDGDIVDQESVANSMPRFIEANGPMLFNHDPGGVIGKIIDWMPVQRFGTGWMPADRAKGETVHGIQVTSLYGRGYNVGSMWHRQLAVDDIWAQIDQGFLRTHSISFEGEGKQDDSAGSTGQPVRRLMCHRVLECSVVTIPAQEQATFAVKMLKAAGVQCCDKCRTAISDGMSRWTRRMPHEQALEIIESAKRMHSHQPNEAELASVGKALSELSQALRGG